ncbi:MAG: hypothetical protein AAFQ82_21670 [Myxococcota bacterium]
MRTKTACSVSIGLALVLMGCPGEIDDPTTLVGEVDCIAYTDQLIERSCAISGCHQTANTSNGNLALVADDLGAELLDTPGSSECNNEPLIDSTDPTLSLMYTKLTDSPTCGDRMPLFSRPPQAFEVDCMLQWVQAQQVGEPQ